jgi:hypothetical protein
MASREPFATEKVMPAKMSVAPKDFERLETEMRDMVDSRQ